MNFLTVVLIGVALGALDGVGIFLEPKEPYKWQILCAATLKGVLVALLTGFSLAATEMKKQNKLRSKVRDLEPLKDVIAGRRHRNAHVHAGAFGDGPPDLRGEFKGGWSPLGFREVP